MLVDKIKKYQKTMGDDKGKESSESHRRSNKHKKGRDIMSRTSSRGSK
jgi:hypothetical protein